MDGMVPSDGALISDTTPTLSWNAVNEAVTYEVQIADTEAIVTNFGDAEPWQGFTNYAAKVCSDLVLGGFDDWFLPSKDELAQMYAQRDVIGGFDSKSFWSSSEYDSQSAWYHYFNNNLQNTAEEYHPLWMRACRAFCVLSNRLLHVTGMPAAEFPRAQAMQRR